LIDRDEPRFAEASREMIESGDYVVPFFNNQFRFDKPPLAYWAQVASYKIFGENDFAARFPSTIAAALIALSVFAWGTRISSERVGCWAAIVFTLSLQTFLHAKAAVADMWLVLFVTLAHWAGYELFRDRLANESKRPTLNVQRPTSNSGWWWTFYLALAFAFLAKGPIGWTPLLTVTATIILLRQSELAPRFKFSRGIVLMLAVVAVWGIPALIRTHGEFLAVGIGRHVIGRSFATMEGHGGNSLGPYLLLLPFYFVTIFVSFFPWSIELPWLVRTLWHEQEIGVTPHARGYSGRDKIDNYLLTGAGIIFIIFSLIKTKLPHYTLPAFPLLSLLLARRWIDSEMPIALFKRSGVTFAIVWLAIALCIAPFAARYFPVWQLYRESRDYLLPEMEFGAIDYQEPSLVWYFRSRVRGWMTSLTAANASQFMEKPGPRFVVLPTKLAAKIFPEQPSNWKTFSTRGFNIAKGKRVDLTLVLKSE
jgi:4-amino-4-deoxy-L-arabinose transferase-like glycosyltransferase